MDMRFKLQAPAALTPGSYRGIHCTGKWVSPTASLDFQEKRNFFASARIGTPGRPGRNRTTITTALCQLQTNIFLWHNKSSVAASLLRFPDHTVIIHTAGRTPLKEWSVCRRSNYIHNTQRTQEANIQALRGIRNHNPNNRTAADLRQRPHGHGDQQRVIE
jgi:hypothetical protein